MSTRTQMYKCGGCEGQFDIDEALRHQNDQRMCREAKMLPIRWTQHKTHKNDLPASPTAPKNPRKPSSTRKAPSTQKPVSARKVTGQKDVRHGGTTDANLTRSRSGRNHARPAPHSAPKKDRAASSSSNNHDHNHGPFPSAQEPIFSPTDVFIRGPTPFAFLGRGSLTGDEYDHPFEYRETDFSVEYPISYEDLREKSPYTSQVLENFPRF